MFWKNAKAATVNRPDAAIVPSVEDGAKGTPLSPDAADAADAAHSAVLSASFDVGVGAAPPKPLSGWEESRSEATALESVAPAPESPGKGKRRRFSLRRTARQPDKRKVGAVPIRILMGYLPEVTERDARDYALGVAEKHFEQPAIAHFDAFKYENGYAYEVHEGGEGHAYLPEIIRHFQEQGAYREGEKVEVLLRTGTRMVKVIRQRVGLQAVLLPESTQLETDELPPSAEKLQSALNQRTGFLVAGAGFFVAGFFALIVGSMLTRYQPYDSPAPPAVTTVDYEQLPIAQWSKVQGLPPNEFVSKLAYDHKHWLQPVIQTGDAPHASSPTGGVLSGAPASGVPALPLSGSPLAASAMPAPSPSVPPPTVIPPPPATLAGAPSVPAAHAH